MAANPFAALLDGVPRYGVNVVSAKMERHPYGVYVELDLVLAALAAAVPADLAEAGKVLEGVTAAEAICRSEDCFQQAAQFKAAADTITALLALLAAQEAQIATDARTIHDLKKRADDAERQRDSNQAVSIEFEARAEAAETALQLEQRTRLKVEAQRDAAETALAAERVKTAKLVGAGDFAKFIGTDTSKDDKDLVLVTYGMLRQLRAAITEVGQ